MINFIEQSSSYQLLETKTIEDITTCINYEDAIIARTINKALPQINKLVAAIINKLQNGGRMFYLVQAVFPFDT